MNKELARILITEVFRKGKFPCCYSVSGNYTDAEIDDCIDQLIDNNYITISTYIIYNGDGFAHPYESVAAKVNEQKCSELFDD
ncbi:hypothetical protein DWY47_13180 [Ruminococcus sp. AF25-23LB]|jgi:hypothetical protein|uniref:hypothetical protein n=1 Tax=Blautia sp. TaxID=1955243 RepID=UPI000E48DEB4|nr:hypothetical protein [Blautia sp.]RHQ38472.1 hypothetical protein DWY50_03430 [Ruminococcus sp. AF25-28AC]RHQ45161.1 hypothetical protein DWY47_13180 [Ruminococcus sp. AF25-23LB]